MGKFFKGIGNKLYCVSQLSVQKHFISLCFLIPDVQPFHGHLKRKKESYDLNIFSSLWLLSEFSFK